MVTKSLILGLLISSTALAQAPEPKPSAKESKPNKTPPQAKPQAEAKDAKGPEFEASDSGSILPPEPKATGTNKIDAWVAEVFSGEKGAIFDQYVLAMVKTTSSDHLEFINAFYQQLNGKGLLNFRSNSDWDLFQNMNPEMTLTPNNRIHYLFKALGVHRVLQCNESKCTYGFLEKNNKIKILRKTTIPKGKQTTDQQIDWWKNFFGYSGIIIDRKDQLFLVAGLKPFNAHFPQALAFQNSSILEFIDQKQEKGNALLALKENRGSLAIYQILVQDQGTIDLPPGTKVIVDEGNDAPTAGPDGKNAKPRAKDAKAKEAKDSDEESDDDAKPAKKPVKDKDKTKDKKDKPKPKPNSQSPTKPAPKE